MEEYDSYVAFSVLRVRPDAEKLAVNAAMIYGILGCYKNQLGNSFYICDGSRFIRHETAFQNYLEKQFLLRKAYCKLNVKYRTLFGVMAKLLYPFKNKIKGVTRISNQILGILKMEEVRRSFYEKRRRKWKI